ncbi:E3 ubiquitin-protein ligase TRIM45-like [Saccostrea cucullata]|uniref:E3 ubiquitin-protein ligase TRIM45-like n=1 Tax=Saccostrea cuccullata TaxID=36930 RepID=UPI002ED08645
MNQVPDTAQHIIECDTESCRNFSEIYCNICHQLICDQCKQRHLEQNNGHDIVRYQERKRQLPSEKCKIHPTQKVDVYCQVCQDPVCSICFVWNHSDHYKSDFETIYNDIFLQCQKEITEIWKTVVPEAKNNVELLSEEKENNTSEIAKMFVDSVLTDNNKKLDEMENFVVNEINQTLMLIRLWW